MVNREIDWEYGGENKMNTNTQIFDPIIQYELLNGCSSTNLSISNGKMGLALFFFHYYRYTGRQMYEDIAGELINDISEDIHTALPIDFQNGLCGIGWGIEYLMQNEFIEGSSDILEDIDFKIMGKDIRRINDCTFEIGLEGIAWYVLLRLHSPFQPVFFDTNYEKDLLKTCARNKAHISDTLINYLKNRQMIQYPYQYIFSQILDAKAEPLSWKNGIKQLIL